MKTTSVKESGAELIAEERQRQITSEGWTTEHDDEHKGGELAAAALSYAECAFYQSLFFCDGEKTGKQMEVPTQWPWHEIEWKPSSDAITNLKKAGALAAAEIDRLQRLNQKSDA